MFRIKKSFTLLEVIVAMTVLSISLAGVFSVYVSTAAQGSRSMIDFELETVAQNLSREIGRLRFVTDSSGCTDSAIDVEKDVCWWEKNASSPLSLDEEYFKDKFPSLNPDTLASTIGSRGFMVTVTKVGGNFDRISGEDGFTCPNSEDSCVFKNFIVTVSHPLDAKGQSFEVLREINN